jgi:hypothetical protein
LCEPRRKATAMLRRRKRRRSQRQRTRQIQTSHTEELVEQGEAQELVGRAAKAATQSLRCDTWFIYYTGWVVRGQYSCAVLHEEYRKRTI